jgi:hypothetical protein
MDKTDDFLGIFFLLYYTLILALGYVNSNDSVSIFAAIPSLQSKFHIPLPPSSYDKVKILNDMWLIKILSRLGSMRYFQVLAMTGWKESYRFIIMFAEVNRNDKKCTFEILLNDDVRHGGRSGEMALW